MAAPAKPESAPSGTPGTKIPTAAELEAQKQTTQGTQPPAESATKAGENVDTTKREAPKEPTREERIIAAQDAALRDLNRQNTALLQQQRDLDARVKKVEDGPEPTKEDLNQDFWKNPTGVIGGLIEKELAKTVAPINERLNRIAMTGQLSAYDQAKVKLKAEYSDIWDKIEPHIDEWATKATAGGTEINEQLLSIAALTASGAYYRGQLPEQVGIRPEPSAPAPKTTTTDTGDRTVATPPHLRPSAPPVPGNDQPAKKEVRALTENEARLARERKQTPEQYLAWLEVPPEQVVHSTIGRPEKK